jgi:outer membrane protein assembly factor BamA
MCVVKAQDLVLVNIATTDSLDFWLKKVVLQKKVSSFDEASTEVKRAQTYFQQNGFLFASANLELSSIDTLSIAWDLGPKFDGLKLQFTEEQLADFKAVNLPVQDSVVQLSFDAYAQFTSQVLYAYSEAGLPFAKLQLENITEKGAIIEAELSIISGRQRRIGNIYIQPYDKFPRAFLTHQVRIKSGQLFKKETLNKRMERMDAIPFVRSVKNPEVQFTQDSTHIYMYLEKTNANSFDGFIGFSNSDGGNLELNGYLDLLLVNNLNWGESLAINYKNDGREQQRFRVNAELPFLASSPFSLEAGLDFFRKDTTFSTTQSDLRLNYQLTHQLRLSANSQWLSSANLLSSTQLSNPNEPIDNFSGNFYGVGLHFRQRREQIGAFLNVTRLHLNTFLGKREAEFGSNDQSKIEFLGEHHFKITNRTYFFTAAHFRWLASQRYFDNELYRFGGIQSIRGFEENSLVASAYATLQTELRYYLSANLYTNSVLDYGYFENELFGISQNLYSFGFGLGLDTPSGLLRLIFANGTSNTQDFAFDNTQVHLSLSTFF